MFAVSLPLFRPVRIDVEITGVDFAGSDRALNIILQSHQEESGAICRCGLTGDYITGANA